MPSSGDSSSNFERLKSLLREMFQLDRGDLDFGLYRIMRLKADEIERFLDQDLLPQVKTKLALVTDEQRAAIEKELAEATASAWKLGVNPDEAPAIVKIGQRLEQAKADARAEADVYAHLANFFERYYNEGDFMSLRRYSTGAEPTYLIPYDGEEVKLHWANADQYYVKTTENYASYAFLAGDGAFRARFEIARADNEKDNVKEANGRQRRFVLAEDAVALDEGELVVRFEHRPLTEREKGIWPGHGSRQQGRIDATTAQRVLAAVGDLAPDRLAALERPAPTDANPERTFLEQHVGRYTAKNRFDYFIHKDLGGFLRRDLDLYLKTDVLDLEDLDRGDPEQLRRALARVRTTRFLGEKIIAFLAQLEDFQKRLWLKKKFVLATRWCVTLDRAPKALFPEIAANEAQWAEWVELYAIDEVANGNGASLFDASEGASSRLRLLEAHPHLMLDTRHFPADFTDRLLAALSDAGPLDDQTDGTLVHGENFQALRLLQARYGGAIQCAYIDPPYNTGDSEILYKNGYLNSSWLSLISNNLDLTRTILSDDSVFFIAIDDFEMANLAKLLDSQSPWLRRETIVVNHHPQGGKGTTLASTHEYMIACVPPLSEKTLIGRQRNGDVELRAFKRSGTAESNFRQHRKNSFYAVLVHPESGEVVGIEQPPSDAYPLQPTEEGLRRIYPLGKDGEERVWRRSYASCLALVKNRKLICSRGGAIYQKIHVGERKSALFSNWVDPRYNAGTFGANLLGDIMGQTNPFAYPKSVHTVGDAIFAADLDTDASILDFFAGSGTTGHAVLNLNREDGGQRKYILVEMGRHFETVLLPRLKKVVYSPDWKAGKPLVRDRGISQIIKTLRIESWEDTLDGLELTPPDAGLLAESDPALVEDYRLRYALDVETAGSPCLLGRDFGDPFACTLSVVRDGAREETPVDLPETFNLLLGLRVASRRRLEGALAIAGEDPEGRNCLVLWRNPEEVDREALNAWFRRNRASLPDALERIYVNGDHTLNAIREKSETWTAFSIEPLFRELMFDTGEP